jgi:glycosyltransferase involved in cell wall biosynthesis
LYYLFACDAIHAPIPGDVGTIGMLGGFFFRKPLFVRYCGNWLQPKTTAERFWRWFMEKTAGGRNVMLATGGAAEPPSHNPNVHWIFSTSLTQQQLKSHASSKPYPPNGHMRLINVARQEAGKGTDVLIQALPHLQRTHPGVSVEIVGDGAALSQLKALSLAPGLQGVIRFHGSVPHHRVLELLRSAYLFCFPSASEGFPKVVLEALACGLPVVSTRVSVLPQLLGSGCGILIDEATPEALARGIETALADSTTYEAMSRRAIETAQQYSLESWRDTIGGYLESAWGPLRSKVGD